MFITEEINPRHPHQKDYLPFQRKRVAIENMIIDGCTVEEIIDTLDFSEDYIREVYKSTVNVISPPKWIPEQLKTKQQVKKDRYNDQYRLYKKVA